MSEYSFQKRVKGDVGAWLKVWRPGWKPEDGIRLKEALGLIWSYAGLRATLLHRLSYHLHSKRIRVLPGIVTRLNITLYGFDVPSNINIEPGLYVPHPVGMVIMAEHIGANVTLIGSITIGMRNEPAFPVIGNNVFVGTGARILGGVKIGDNAIIGANAVVVHDVPANATAVGIPARVISSKKTNS